MNLNDFDYELPPQLIGQSAIEPRDSCKLMVINRKMQTLQNRIFKDIAQILDDKCVLVLNDTKVFPARLFGSKTSGGKVEILLLKQLSLDTFSCIGRGKYKIGQSLLFSSDLKASVESKGENGELVVKFNFGGVDLIHMIDDVGSTPLPPYIHSDVPETVVREKYQTIYAREKGSAAAPTAGLHFTKELLEILKNKKVQIEYLTLHVGLGTFKPVSDEQISSKILHSESFILSEFTAERLNQAKKMGKTIVAVGTTTCRVLESQSREDGFLFAGEGETSIFIQPGYKFKFVNGLITNFHLPKTSLLMLVSALISKPNSPIQFENFSKSLVGKAYSEAISQKYKFFSFGDAMLIL